MAIELVGGKYKALCEAVTLVHVSHGGSLLLKLCRRSSLNFFQNLSYAFQLEVHDSTQ